MQTTYSPSTKVTLSLFEIFDETSARLAIDGLLALNLQAGLPLQLVTTSAITEAPKSSIASGNTFIVRSNSKAVMW